MAGKPGPIWTEINNDLVAADNFVFLKDAAKAALLIWAIRYPSGNLPPLKQLARDLAKDGAKAFTLLRNLEVSGFVLTTPNGSRAIVGGIARAHKTSASRVAKFRERTAGHCNVTIGATEGVSETPIVTLHSPPGNADCNVSSNVSETPPKSQKEIPLRNPLRKTPNSKDEFGVSARDRAPPPKPSPFTRVLWQEIGQVPEDWQRKAAAERQRLGYEPVDMAMVAANFADTYGPQLVNRRTSTEWQGQFNKFTRREFAGKPNGTASGKSRQIDELARIIEREQRAVSGGEILQDGDGFFDRSNDLCLPGETWREHGGTRQ
jgi:hypothetical protein